MSNVYCFEQGNCRGDDFTERFVFDKNELVEAIETSLNKLSTMNEDDKEEHMEEISSDFEGMLWLLVNGSPYICDDNKNVNKRLQLIKEDKTFQIENEESTIGFGSTKKEAKSTAYFVDNDGDDW